MDDEWDERNIWLRAQVAAGGPAEFVMRFLAEVRADHFEVAREYLDPAFDWGDIRALNLDRIRTPGWFLSGRPEKREGYERVLFVYVEGADDEFTPEGPMNLPGCEFLVREADDGAWLIYQILRDERVL